MDGFANAIESTQTALEAHLALIWAGTLSKGVPPPTVYAVVPWAALCSRISDRFPSAVIEADDVTTAELAEFVQSIRGVLPTLVGAEAMEVSQWQEKLLPVLCSKE